MVGISSAFDVMTAGEDELADVAASAFLSGLEDGQAGRREDILSKKAVFRPVYEAGYKLGAARKKR